MTFTVSRESKIYIEGIDDPVEARRILTALSEDTVGMKMVFQGLPLIYVRHVSTSVSGPIDAAPKAEAS